jgi:hypothetical protein
MTLFLRNFIARLVFIGILGVLLPAAASQADSLHWEPVSGPYSLDLERNYYCPDFSLDPRLFDVFEGLPPEESRLSRVFLTGWWKLRKIPDTASEDHRYRPENDVGLKERFFAVEYDDSKWVPQFVPWDWNAEFIGYLWDGPAWFNRWSKDLIQCPPDVKKMLPENFGKADNRYDFKGAGWYRRTFTLPQAPPGTRAILHFEYVDTESTVWLNGRKVGSHSNIVRHGLTNRGVGVEDHDFDVTEAVRFGKSNTIAVRVFMDGAQQQPGLRAAGGIWQACWIDLVPPVYARQVLITPNVADHTIKVDCSLKNTPAKSQVILPRIVVKPWRSYRYSPNGSSGTVNKRIAERTLPSGDTSLSETLEMVRPVTWDFENPFLYHVQVFAVIPGWNEDREVLIGQARFGFREITVREGQFYLNGKRLFLQGTEFEEPYPWNVLLAHNFERWIERFYDKQRYSNLFFGRFHTGKYPQAFYDLADEKGYMIYDELLTPDCAGDLAVGERRRLSWVEAMSDPKGRDVLAAQTAQWIHKTYNNPSVILYSLGNEHLSWGAEQKGELLSQILSYCRSMYDLYKQFDATRPLTDCSGSNCVRRLDSRETPKEWTKADFHDAHEYDGGLGWGCFFHIERNVPIWREAYRRLSGGVVKPIVYGECVSFEHRAGYRDFDRRWGRLAATLPNLDRKEYVDAMEENRSAGGYYWAVTDQFVKNVGIRAFLTEPDAARARYIGDYFIETFRRLNGELDGYNLHFLWPYFVDSPRVLERKTMIETLRRKLSPLFVCCDVFDKNVPAGESIHMKVFALNDSMHDEKGITLSFDLWSSDKKKMLGKEKGIQDLPAGTRKVFPYEIPLAPTLPTGEYVLRLMMRNGTGVLLSENEYSVYVLGPEWKTFCSPPTKVLAYFGPTPEARQFREILKRTRTSFAEAKNDFSGLEESKVLLIAPNSLDQEVRKHGEKISAWLKKGGKLVCFEQTREGQIPFLPQAVLASAGDPLFVDVIVRNHPLFRGIPQTFWQLWNSGDGPWERKAPCRRYVLPLSESVLASAGFTPVVGEIGMVISEVKVGRGICLFSQTDAVRRYGTDSVATRYIQNLLQYALGDQWDGRFSAPLRDTVLSEWKAPDKDKTFTVDLRPSCNRGFADEQPGDGRGGWTDEGPKKDLRIFPAGRHEFRGVPFDVIDPGTNAGRSCLAVAGKSQYLPARIENIRIDRSNVKRVFFLVACADPPERGKEVGHLLFHYRPGGVGNLRENRISLISGENIDHWINPKEILPKGFLAWRGHHPLMDLPVGIYMIEWKNTVSEPISAVTFISSNAHDGMAVLIAVSGELD